MPEHYLTQHLLHEALVMNFDICPWEIDAHAETSFFRRVTHVIASNRRHDH